MQGVKNTRETVVERFWANVDKRGPDECWPWRTGRMKYRRFGPLPGIWVLAHRYSFELAKGPIPPLLTVDHLCKNTCCVNPAHLEAVTLGENTLRGNSPPAMNARKTNCKRGHPFTPENTYRGRNGRECRKCKSMREIEKRRLTTAIQAVLDRRGK